MLGDDWLLRPLPSREDLATALPESEVGPVYQLLRDLHLKREVVAVSLHRLADVAGGDDLVHVVEGTVVEARSGRRRLRTYALLGIDESLDLRRLHQLAVACAAEQRELYLCLSSSENIVYAPYLDLARQLTDCPHPS